MKKTRLLLLLALLMTAATGAWAQDAKHLITATYDKQTRLLEQPLPYATTVGELYEAVTGQSFSDLMSTMSMLETPLSGIGSTNTDVVSIGGLNDASTPVTVNADGKATVAIRFGSYAQGIFVTVTPPLYVTMKDGTEDADKWTVKVGEGQAQALPIGGLKGDGSETVTLQYNGRMKVKGVTATSDAAASGPEVTTFSELQAALSAGKDVKLMNDIVCTAEIKITSGALTIDGNGKTLSTTSEIRAFKVGSSATVAFKDLTLTGFVSGGGPAINNSGTIVLDGCTISNCHVNNSNGGGAIENKSTSGKLYAINTTFSGNYSGEIGGAINNYRGSLYMSGCTFTNNYTTESDAYYGGAIGINGGDEVRLINCSFSGNQYGTNAGPSDIGVYSNPTNYTIAGCTGAAIASNNGDITTNATGTATLDYSDLSNISFTIEQVDPLAVPMTIEAITAGSINVKNPKAGMQYSKNGGAKTTMSESTTIDVAAGDKVAFYGKGTEITSYSSGTKITGSGDGFTCKVYGNIMSLVDEENFATATTLSANYTFNSLFYDFTTLTDASGLLLPATTLAKFCYRQMFQGCTALTTAPELPATQLAAYCYYYMFYGCTALTAAPELPATELAQYCYYSMFQGCTALTAAPELPATELAQYCYYQMFRDCSKLATVTCLATSGINQSGSTANWLRDAGSQVQGTKTIYTVSTADWPSGNNGIPSGWTRANVTQN